MRRWLVINLDTLINGYTHVISFEIVEGYWKLRSSLETMASSNGLLEKPDITYPSPNS